VLCCLLAELWTRVELLQVWLAEVNTRELQQVRQEVAGVTADLATARQRDTNLSSHLARLKLRVDGLQLAFETGDGKFLISEAARLPGANLLILLQLVFQLLCSQPPLP